MTDGWWLAAAVVACRREQNLLNDVGVVTSNAVDNRLQCGNASAYIRAVLIPLSVSAGPLQPRSRNHSSPGCNCNIG